MTEPTPVTRARRFLLVVAAVVTASLLGGCVPDDNPEPLSGVSVADTFTEHGIGVLEDVSSAWPDGVLMASPASAVDVMQSEVDSGGGISGADLDEFVAMPIDAPPFSFIVAAWLFEQSTPRAQAARTWFADEVEWTLARSIWFPRAALLLFVADAMEASIADFGAAQPQSQSLVGPEVASVQSGPALISAASAALPTLNLPQAPCTAVSTFFSDTINAVFGAIQLPPDFLAKGGVLGEISGFLAGLFNTAVQLAKTVVLTVIQSLTAPILRAIGAGVAIVGVLSHFSTYLLGVSMNVSTDRLIPLDGREGYWYGMIDAKRPLEAQLQDCLNVLGKPALRDIIKTGAPITWRPDPPRRADGSPFDRAALVYLGLKTNVDANKRLVLKWVSAQEEPSSQPEQFGIARMTAEVPKSEVSDLFDLAKKFLSDAIDQVASHGGPLKVEVKSALEGFLAPIFARIEAEVLGAGRSLLMIVGSGQTTFIYRDPDEPVLLPTEENPACYVGDWRFNRVLSSRWLSTGFVISRFDLSISPDGIYAVRAYGWQIDFDGSTRITEAKFDGTGFITTAAPLKPLGDPDDPISMPIISKGMQPTSIACSADGKSLTIVGAADPNYGATTWQFLRG